MVTNNNNSKKKRDIPKSEPRGIQTSGLTDRQKKLQAEAKAKGGLTSSGVTRFKAKVKRIKKETGLPEKTIKKELFEQKEKQLGFRKETTIERNRRLFKTFKEGGTFKTETERGLGQSLFTGTKPLISEALVQQFIDKYGEKKGREEALKFAAETESTPSFFLEDKKYGILPLGPPPSSRVNQIDEKLSLQVPYTEEFKTGLEQERSDILNQQAIVKKTPLRLISQQKLYESSGGVLGLKTRGRVTIQDRINASKMPDSIIRDAENLGKKLANYGTKKESYYDFKGSILDKYNQLDSKLMNITDSVPLQKWENELLIKADQAEKKRQKQMDEILSYNITGPRQPHIPPLESFTYNFGAGYLHGLRTKPTKTLLTTGAFFLLPGVLKAGGKVLSPIGNLAPKTFNFLGQTVKIGLPSLYATDVASRLSYSNNPAFTFGEISSTELSPMLVGGLAGSYAWPKASGFFRTIGRKKVPIEKLASKHVIDTNQLERVPPSEHLKLFRQGGKSRPFGELDVKYNFKVDKFGKLKEPLLVFHAATKGKPTAFSDVVWGKGGKVTVGQDYLPGGFVAPGEHSALYFLKLGKNYPKLWGSSIFDTYTTPKLAAFYVPGARYRTTYSTGTKSGFGQPLRKFKGKDKPGFVDVPGLKTEPEGIISPDSIFNRIRNKYYFKHQGTRVPVDEFIFSGGKSSGTKPKLKSFISISSEYGLGGSSVIGPSSFGLLLSLPKNKNDLLKDKKYKFRYSSRGYNFSKLKSSLMDISKTSKLFSSVSKTKTSSKMYSEMSISSYSPKYYSSVSKVSKSMASSISKLKSSIKKSSSRSNVYKSPSGLSSGSSRDVYDLFPPSYPPITYRKKQGKIKKKKKKIGFDFETQYRPSLTSLVYEIYGKKPKTLTGLKIRPLIKPRKTRRRR